MSLNAQEDMLMRTFDLAPLYRSTVGFDRLFSLLDNVAGYDNAAPGYPPYNIERTGDNTYRISVAVAGFAENEISIVAKENTLTIKGEKQTKADENKSERSLPGHRSPHLRTHLPARRACRGEGRVARERLARMSISYAKYPRPRSRARSPSTATANRRLSKRKRRNSLDGFSGKRARSSLRARPV